MNKTYLITYIIIVSVLLGIVLFANPTDFVTMVLFGMIVILTSIYTYSTRNKK